MCFGTEGSFFCLFVCLFFPTRVCVCVCVSDGACMSASNMAHYCVCVCVSASVHMPVWKHMCVSSTCYHEQLMYAWTFACMYPSPSPQTKCCSFGKRIAMEQHLNYETLSLHHNAQTQAHLHRPVYIGFGYLC